MGKELPKGWVDEISLLDVANVYTGKKDANFASKNGQYNFFTCAYNPLKADSFSYEGQVLILPGNGVNVGEVFYYEGKFEAYQRTYVIDEIEVDPKYLFYHLKRFWRERGTSEQFGSATNYIKIGNFKKYKLEVSPLPEQQRIVAKLDGLFERLEQVKTRLANIPALLKNFRQAILTQAVTGKLTEEWRGEMLKEGKELGEWETLELIDVILEKPRNGYSPMGVDYETPVKSLSLSATTSGKFDGSKVKFLDVDKPEDSSHLWLKNGDILIQRSNSLDYVGTSAIYDGEDNEFIYPDIMMKVRVNDRINNSFLNYVLSSSPTKKYFRDNATGTAGNMPKINQGVVSKTPVNCPPIEEQTEIVQRVESLFTKADAIETKYKVLKTQIDHLPQAILTKAFKGELVEQLPTDGDAKDLLKEIMELRAAGEGKRRKSKFNRLIMY